MPIVNLPPASDRPPGSVSFGTTAEQCSQLRHGLLIIAGLSALTGIGIGFILWGPKGGAPGTRLVLGKLV